VWQTIKALNWVIGILWVFALVLPITVAVSLSKLAEPGAIGVRQSEVSYSNNIFSLFSPFYINNTGFYDLTDINFTVSINDAVGKLSTTSALIPMIKAGNIANSSFNINIYVTNLSPRILALLTNDTDLNLDVSASFRVAYAITLGVSTNLTQPWRAPFYNFTVSTVTYNASKAQLSISVSFENHAGYPLNGSFTLQAYNNRSKRIGYFQDDVNVQPSSPFSGSYEFGIDASELTSNNYVGLYFEDTEILEQEWQP
jgi:hypothetical protein